MNTQPPIEDINAIVNRFQAWAGAQAPARAKDGVREITYDEAIRSRRHRTSAEATLPAAEKPAPASRRMPGAERLKNQPSRRKKPPRRAMRHMLSLRMSNIRLRVLALLLRSHSRFGRYSLKRCRFFLRLHRRNWRLPSAERQRFLCEFLRRNTRF
ncbi:MAG: hypothetical protein WA869_14560 [Alloacidobacterium sp.]